MDNGNGALMRILPFSLYCIFHGLDTDETAQVISGASALTHGHPISQMSCLIWTELLRVLAEDRCIIRAVKRIESLPYDRWFPKEALAAYTLIMHQETLMLAETDIGETGYVLDTLYTALYSLLHADSYEHAILTAAGLGYDTDTAAAVTGMAAGILYGAENIPCRWMNKLRKKEMLEETARCFTENILESGRCGG